MIWAILYDMANSCWLSASHLPASLSASPTETVGGLAVARQCTLVHCGAGKLRKTRGKRPKTAAAAPSDLAALNSPAPLAQKKRGGPEDFPGGGAGV